MSKNEWHLYDLFTKLHVFLSSQLLSHLSVPDEQYQCVRMKARVSYIGMLQDGEWIM